MKRFKLLLFAAALIVCLIPAYSAYKSNQTSITAETKSRQVLENDDHEIFKNFKGMEKAYNGPLPWEKDDRFKEMMQKHNIQIRMAAYKAVLPEPIEAEIYNVGLAAEQLAGTIVPPATVFSQNKILGPYTEQKGYKAGPTYIGNRIITTAGGGVCKVASVLYNVVTFSDLPVMTRSAHSMLVPYVPPGQDATVCYGGKDFQFLNDTDGPILIWSQKVGNALYMALYGFKKPPEVVWHHKIINKTKSWTVTKYNLQLKPGEERVVMPGMEGMVVKSWVTVKTPDGKGTIKNKGHSYYAASPRVVERGPVLNQ